MIDQALYWAAVESLDEADYLCSILNSEALRAGVERYQAQGQWGARHFDKYIFNLPIPRYDSSNDLHRELVAQSRLAKLAARSIPVQEGEYFTRIRKRIRDDISERGIAGTLDNLVTELFV